MILTQSLTAAQAQRSTRSLPDGTNIWVSPVFPGEEATPERPMALFVEQHPQTTIPSHFHTVNQFQVVVAGQGTLGKRAVQPWTVHYTNGFTGYGPLCTGAAGMAFFTLRNRFDPGAHYFPASQSFMKPAPKRHYLAGPLHFDATALADLPQARCDSVLALEDDGLAAWCLRLGPHTQLLAPDPAPSGGQYLLVASGSLLHHGVALPQCTCIYVSTDSGPYMLHSGAEGLEALLLQCPVAEAYPAAVGTRAHPGVQAPGHGRPSRPVRRSMAPAQAHPEHLALVRQGAAAIAAWRIAHPGERLQLAQADLAGVNLRGAPLQGARLAEADFTGADLTEADLQQADLRAAMLVEADLTGARLQHASLVRANLAHACLAWARGLRAHLHGAHLHGAQLQEANFQRAYLVSTDLSGADLRGAYLERADLQWANLQDTLLAGARLHEADLRQSVLGGTVFDHTRLLAACGLETCRHQAPSALDLGTLAGADGLPEVFLRGCGWHQDLLTNLPAPGPPPALLACIERSLALPPASQALGLQLLGNIGSWLQQRHPDLPLRYRLDTLGLMLRLLVETPLTARAPVEESVQAYGAMLAESQAPDAVLPGVGWLTEREPWHATCQRVGQALREL